MAGLWVTPADLGPALENSPYADDACKAASYLLWALSGRKYTGTTTVTEHYIRFAPLINTHLIREAAIIYSHIDETLPLVKPWATNETRIRLRGQPVQEVHAVRNANGGLVSEDTYYVVDHSAVYFYRPALIIPADIEITYTYGIDPPLLGKMAARRVATEFIKLWNGSEDCALPERVTSVSRQGVSYTVLDSQDFLEEMRLGIYEIDLFLKTVNPNKAQRRSKVFTPDLPHARRYAPVPLKYPATSYDFTVSKRGGTKTMTLAFLDAAYLAAGTWTLELILRSNGSTRSITVANGAVLTVTGAGAGNVRLNVPYTDVYEALKMHTSGVWDLYATNTSNQRSLVASANLILDLSI
jgi:hypothetical protein